jgi:ADP-ribosylglycohydrolase
VSSGIDGCDFAGATDRAIEAATLAASRGYWVAAADVASRIRWSVSLGEPSDASGSLEAIALLIGTSLATQESVPAAFGILATFPQDAWAAVTAAASLSDDSGTVAAMVGAIAGATGGSFPADAIATVESVNSLELAAVTDALLALR